MQIGFGAPVSGAWATPENLAGFAARAEKAGYATLWSFQRLIVPEGSGMDPVYQDVLDPTQPLAYAAAVTARSGSASRSSTCPSSPRLPGQAGRVARRALRRAARPGPGHRLDAEEFT
jgi:alkanesulfonate monooxygenase SsuD/methylene tetrahydromethanopterin reductase-like flavin-dependent oxidoreductase (luciferase family)